MDLESVRRFYAEELEAVANVRAKAVVDAFAKVPRERFLGPGPWQVPSGMAEMFGPTPYRTTPDANPARLYHNVAVAIDPQRHLNNGQPSTLAALIDALDLQPGESVFHVGCGLGYYTAVIAEVVGPTGRVVAVDVDAELATRAGALLADHANVRVLSGNGAEAVGPMDAILVNAGATHPRREWLDALRPGGRLLVPLTLTLPGLPAGTGTGFVLKVQRAAEGAFSARFLLPIGIYDCEGARDPKLEPALRELLRGAGWRQVRTLRRDAHERQASCLLHAEGFCLSAA